MNKITGTFNSLGQILEQECGARGYIVYTGDRQLVASTVRSFPAVWITPPVMTRQTGITEGVRHYSVSLVMMALGDRLCGRDIWADRIDRHARDIISSLAMRKEVKSVENVTVEFNPTGSRTTAGEISATVGFEILVPYHSNH